MGVFLGTLISVITVPFWLTPYLVYKNVFNRPVMDYFLKYAYYAAIGIGTYFITSFASDFTLSSNFLELLLKGIVCIVVPNVIYILIFHKTTEFKYLFGIIRGISQKLLKKFKSNKGIPS